MPPYHAIVSQAVTKFVSACDHLLTKKNFGRCMSRCSWAFHDNSTHKSHRWDQLPIRYQKLIFFGMFFFKHSPFININNGDKTIHLQTYHSPRASFGVITVQPTFQLTSDGTWTCLLVCTIWSTVDLTGQYISSGEEYSGIFIRGHCINRNMAIGRPDGLLWGTTNHPALYFSAAFSNY